VLVLADAAPNMCNSTEILNKSKYIQTSVKHSEGLSFNKNSFKTSDGATCEQKFGRMDGKIGGQLILQYRMSRREIDRRCSESNAAMGFCYYQC
jgi:hypothetical protein